MTAKFNLCQQAFVLSAKSNQLVSINGHTPNTKPDLEKELYDYLKNFLQTSTDTMGTWKVVWGPAVYISPRFHPFHPKKGVPDNVVYVAQNTETPAYVVAVAGTNVYSAFGWLVEDIGVETTTTWINAFKKDQDGNPLLPSYGNPALFDNPCLATGTATGVQILLSTRPEPDTNENDSEAPRLFEYLNGVSANGATSNTTLIITGHSLAGALSPILALALFNPNGGPLNMKDWGSVYVLPTAGATPGNADLSNSFAEVFKGVPKDVPDKPDPSTTELWNRNIANTKDFVPLAWIPDQLDTVPPPLGDKHGGIYPGLEWALGTKLELNGLIDVAKYLSKKGAKSIPQGGSAAAGAYTALPIAHVDCEEIDSTAYIVSILPPPPPPDSDTKQSYLQHWALQHTEAYGYQIFKVDDLFAEGELREVLSGGALGLLKAPKAEAE